jgi:hypothetical protein
METNMNAAETVDEFPCVFPGVKEFELHISPDPDFTAKGWGKRVKALGGRFSEARGMNDRRFVHVPATEKGVLLVADILCSFPPIAMRKTLVIARTGGGVPSYARLNDQFHYDSRHPNALVWVQNCLAKVETSYGAWWSSEGRLRAVAEAAQKREHEAELKAAAPGVVEAAVRDAVARGVSVEELRAAFERGLKGAV